MSFTLSPDSTTINDAGTNGFTSAGLGSAVVSTGTVGLGAFVYGDDSGLVLTSFPWSVVVNGNIFGASGYGIEFSDQPLAPLTTLSTLTISSTGDVYGGTTGIRTRHALNVSNAGIVVGAAIGIDVSFATNDSKAFSISNLSTGEVLGFSGAALYIAATSTGIHTISNAGVMSGVGSAIATESTATSIEKVTNSGRLGSEDSPGSGSIFLYAGADTLTNSGFIYGSVDMGAGADILANTKLIDGNVQLGLDNDKLTNTGTINGDIIDSGGANSISSTSKLFGGIFLAGGDDTVGVAGLVDGDVSLGGGNDRLTNTGTINGDILDGGGSNTISSTSKVLGSILMADGDDIVGVAGLVDGDVSLGGGNDKLTTAGTINGKVESGNNNDTISGGATINYWVDLGNGADTFVNSGKILGETLGNSVIGGEGDDTLTNSGTISFDVSMGNGADVVTNTGTILGITDLGANNDIYNGGVSSDQVIDGNGADKISLGADKYVATTPGSTGDIYIATGAAGSDLNDTIDGGLGLGDVYFAGDASSSVFINLDTLAHSDKYFSPSLPEVPNDPLLSTIAASTAFGLDVSGSSDPTALSFIKDTITNFEFAAGGEASDLIFGNAAANRLYGDVDDAGDLDPDTGGDDVLYGLAGNDTIVGGAGNDTIVGGLGRDIMYGSNDDGLGGLTTDADVFVFTSLSELGNTKLTRDVIRDFEHGVDVIDMSAMGSFTFVGLNAGASMWGVASNSIRAIWTATGTLIQGDLQADGKADFSIELTGHIAVDAGDFVL